jgi:hypothetical protein
VAEQGRRPNAGGGFAGRPWRRTSGMIGIGARSGEISGAEPASNTGK